MSDVRAPLAPLRRGERASQAELGQRDFVARSAIHDPRKESGSV